MAYTTAVKSVPVVLSSSRKHGFENYVPLSIAPKRPRSDQAEDILKYMAYGPSASLAPPSKLPTTPKPGTQ